MILKRLGNKKKIAEEIQKHFPKHTTYIEPFFGAGGMFFNKPKAKYNVVNDLDNDVFNLFQVLNDDYKELESAFYMMPVHSELLNYWKDNLETEPIKKALRFLFLSNLTFLGGGEQMRTRGDNSKQLVLDKMKPTFDFLFGVNFSNSDFRKFLKSIEFRSGEFIYCDPPYLGTNDNYSNSFKEEDSNDLFDALIETKCNFAMSEFNHPFILKQAEKRGLNVIIIGERQNLKNRRIEILVTNYKNNQQSLF
tara:strand:- start:47 stop:796 length:750 start_codon:yes stop_codon:yes gene_type:complete